MGSGKAHKPLRNPKAKNKPLGPKKTQKRKKNHVTESNAPDGKNEVGLGPATASQRRSFFLDRFQSENGVQLSSLELESITETRFVESDGDVGGLGDSLREAFGDSWKEELCDGNMLEWRIETGSPSVLVIAPSALRSIELIRGMHSLTSDCRPAKLFSKHMKIEEQECHFEVSENGHEGILKPSSVLKNRVNFASGTPSRIKKLIDMEVLGLSRLAMIVLDIRPDIKGYSLLSLPQVRDEFWDLYKNYFYQRLVRGEMRVCLFGPLADGKEFKGKKKGSRDK